MSSSWREQYDHALSDYESGQIEQAKKKVQALLTTHRDQAELWCLEAQLRLASDEWEAAAFALEQALTLAPHSFTAYHLQSHLFNATEKYEAAERAAETAQKHATTDTQKFEALLQRSEGLFGIGHHKLRHAADDRWNDDEEDLEPVMTTEIQEIFQTGLELLEQAMKIHDTYPEAWELYANYLAVFQHTEQSLEAWEKAVELAPNNPEYVHGLAQALEDIEDFQSAHDMYCRLYEIDHQIFHQEGAEPLLFSPEEFSAVAHEVWSEVEHELDEETLPLLFKFHVTTFPPRSLIEEASAESLFDPRVGLHVELKADPIAAFSKNPEPPTVNLHLFQYNIERDLDGDDLDALFNELHELLLNCVEQIYEYVSLDDDGE